MRRTANGALAARRAAIQPRHVCLEPRLIQKHQPPRVQFGLQLISQAACLGDVAACPLGRFDALFFNVRPSRRNVLNIVPMLADTPSSACSQS
jgi:hypothetical protein